MNRKFRIEIQREKIFKILNSHKEKETLPFVTAWMDLGGILLSELSQKRKDMSCESLAICEILVKKGGRAEVLKVFAHSSLIEM